MVDPQVVKQFELSDAKHTASKYAAVDVKGLDGAQRLLFELLSARIKPLGNDIVELFAPKNVTYRVFDYFAQVIPRAQRLVLVLNLDFDEVDDGSGFCNDTSRKAYVANCTVKGGVFLKINDVDDVERALPFIKFAYDRVTD